MSEAGYTSEVEVDTREAIGSGSTETAGASSARAVEALDSVVIRFVGDSGDGMQLTGSEFSKAVAKAGHGFATHPDYPSEIRAPTGTLFGVSGYQIQYGSRQVFTSGDAPDALVAMNPAALKTNLADVKHGGIIIANTGAFADANLAKAGYTSNPLEDGSLDGYRLFKIDISALTAAALRDSGLSKKEVGRCKNYFALGLMLCLYGRPLDKEIDDIHAKFAKKPQFAEANANALRAGYAYADAAEIFAATYQVREAAAKPGVYRSITGNHAAALGFVAASESSGVGLFLGSYPITPATDILHELSALKHFNVTTYQAEDEIAGICSAIGAAYGPSTGLPTKIEQSDLLQAIYGRNGECPIPVIAARSPADCFDCAIEAFRIAVKYMTPVILLTDGGIANAAEPWRIPDVASLPKVEVSYRTDPEGFQPYARDENLARAWVRPGTPGMEHRVGGLEKDFLSGNISHDPLNHQRMVDVRAAKVAGTAQDIPPTTVEGPASGELLVIGWGSTYGTIAQAREKAEAEGRSVAHVHLRHLNPLPPDLGELLGRYKTVLVPELNMGQLSKLLRERYLCDVVPLNKVQGKPFKVSEVHDRILELS